MYSTRARPWADRSTRVVRGVHGHVAGSGQAGRPSPRHAADGQRPGGRGVRRDRVVYERKRRADQRSFFCTDRLGIPQSNAFQFIWTDGLGLKGVDGGGPVAYLWANKATASSYPPRASYRYSSSGLNMRITRQSAGRYSVSPFRNAAWRGRRGEHLRQQRPVSSRKHRHVRPEAGGHGALRYRCRNTSRCHVHALVRTVSGSARPGRLHGETQFPPADTPWLRPRRTLSVQSAPQSHFRPAGERRRPVRFDRSAAVLPAGRNRRARARSS